MRDLCEDLDKGLINLPALVIHGARSEGLDTIQYTSLVRLPAVKQWLWDEYQRATDHLDRFERELVRLRGKRGSASLELFHKSIRRFSVKASKNYGWQRADPNGTEEASYGDRRASGAD
jgi:hypothetical protein